MIPRGRFAPSPSGPLHFGSLVAALGVDVDSAEIAGALGISIDVPLQWLMRLIAKVKRDELFITPPEQS